MLFQLLVRYATITLNVEPLKSRTNKCAVLPMPLLEHFNCRQWNTRFNDKFCT